MTRTSPLSPDEQAPAAVWQPAARRELILLALYFLAIVAISDVLNVRLGAEYLTLMVVMAAVVISRASMRQFLRDWWVYLLGLLLWRFSGAIAGLSPFPVHLEILINTDRFLTLGHDPVLLIHDTFVDPAHLQPLDWITAIVYNLHLPELYIAAYFLWRLSRPIYLQFVSAVQILLVLGFLTFILFPTMPPWMASSWYHRIPGIVSGFGRVLHAHPRQLIGEPIFYVWKLTGDPVAEIPSEHAAIPMLEFLAFRKLFPRAALLFLPWLAFVLFTVVYLGMHWLTDPLVGWVYAIVVFWFVSWFVARRSAH